MNDQVDVSFESARQENIDVVVSMMRSLERDDPNKRAFQEQSRRSSYSEFLADPSHGCIWLFVADDKIVGYLVLAFAFSFEYGGRNAFIDEIYVVPEYRGQRIGWRALQLAEKAARAEGIVALHLEVSRHNISALNLYRRAEFINHDRYLLTKWLDRKEVR